MKFKNFLNERRSLESSLSKAIDRISSLPPNKLENEQDIIFRALREVAKQTGKEKEILKLLSPKIKYSSIDEFEKAVKDNSFVYENIIGDIWKKVKRNIKPIILFASALVGVGGAAIVANPALLPFMAAGSAKLLGTGIAVGSKIPTVANILIHAKAMAMAAGQAT